MPSAKQGSFVEVQVTEEEIKVWLTEMGRLYRVLGFRHRIYTGPNKTAVFEVRLEGSVPTHGRFAPFLGFYVPYPTPNAQDATMAMYRAVTKASEAMDAMLLDAKLPRLFENAE